MVFAEKTYQLWKDFCPYIHRTLLTTEFIIEWLKNLKIIKSKKDILIVEIFLEYLEKNELIYPLIQARRDSNIATQIYKEHGYLFSNVNEDWLKRIDKYYHPFQFFQILTFFKILKESSVEISIENTMFKFFFRTKEAEKLTNTKLREKRIKSIEKEKAKKIKSEIKNRYKGYNHTIKILTRMNKKEKKANIEKNKIDLKKDLKNLEDQDKDFFFSILNAVCWLKPDFLDLWIKLDSLFYFKNYIYSPNSKFTKYRYVDCKFNDFEKIRITSENFRKWREDKLKNKENFLSEDEIIKLRNFQTDIETIFFRDNDISLDGLDNWGDLIDLISSECLEKITGFTTLKINIIAIKRFLERSTWFLFKKKLNEWYPEKENKQPYFCFDTNQQGQMIDYRMSTLLNFNLFIDLPFILYVEGETEENILREYLTTKSYGFNYIIQNMKSQSKSPFYIELCKDVQDKIYFFFLDYHNERDYEDYKKIVAEDGVFFFPDFVTENFSVEDINKSYLNWLNTVEIVISQPQTEELLLKLNNCKIESNNLIYALRKTGNPKGFEAVLIDFSKIYFTKELLNKFPELKYNPVFNTIDKEKLTKFFKTQFTEWYLIKIIRNSITQDRDRNLTKFPFEIKLEPFLKKMSESFNRNLNIKYNVK